MGGGGKSWRGLGEELLASSATELGNGRALCGVSV